MSITEEIVGVGVMLDAEVGKAEVRYTRGSALIRTLLKDLVYLVA